MGDGASFAVGLAKFVVAVRETASAGGGWRRVASCDLQGEPARDGVVPVNVATPEPLEGSQGGRRGPGG